jgi:excisionase family DNA binding protein
MPDETNRESTDAPVANLRALVTALIDALNALEVAQRSEPRQMPDVHPWDAAPRRKPGGRSAKISGAKSNLTLEEVCAELDVSRSTFYDWRAKGRAPRCIKLPNGDIRIRRSELERWLAEREDAA